MSKIDHQEVDNALNQAAKEIGTRFDFRGVGASIAWSGDHAVDIRANSEERAKAVLDVFRDKLVKRGVSLKTLDPADPRLSGKEYRMAVALKEGINQENAKKPITAAAPTMAAAIAATLPVRVITHNWAIQLTGVGLCCGISARRGALPALDGRVPGLVRYR